MLPIGSKSKRRWSRRTFWCEFCAGGYGCELVNRPRRTVRRDMRRAPGAISARHGAHAVRAARGKYKTHAVRKKCRSYKRNNARTRYTNRITQQPMSTNADILPAPQDIFGKISWDKLKSASLRGKFPVMPDGGSRGILIPSVSPPASSRSAVAYRAQRSRLTDRPRGPMSERASAFPLRSRASVLVHAR